MRSMRPSASSARCSAAAGVREMFMRYTRSSNRGAVHDAPLGVLALPPVGVVPDELQLALELDDVRALAGLEIDQESAISRRRGADELAQLALHGPLAGDEELGRLAIRHLALENLGEDHVR